MRPSRWTADQINNLIDGWRAGHSFAQLIVETEHSAASIRAKVKKIRDRGEDMPVRKRQPPMAFRDLDEAPSVPDNDPLLARLKENH